MSEIKKHEIRRCWIDVLFVCVLFLLVVVSIPVATAIEQTAQSKEERKRRTATLYYNAVIMMSEASSLTNGIASTCLAKSSIVCHPFSIPRSVR